MEHVEAALRPGRSSPSCWYRVAVLAVLFQAVMAHAQTAISVPVDTQTRVTSFTYFDDTGLLKTQVIEPNSSVPGVTLTNSFHYKSQGGLDTSTASGWNGYATEDRINSTGWDDKQRFPTSSTNALNYAVSRTYDPRFGTVLTSTDLNGVVTKWEYDGFGRKVKESRGFASATATAFTDYTTWVYGPTDYVGTMPPINGAQQAFSVFENTYSSSGAKIAPQVVTTYDQLGRKIRVATEVLTAGNVGKSSYVDTVYNARGLVDRESAPYFQGDTPQWTQYLSYDALGRVTLQQAPNGIRTETSYTALSTTINVHSTEGDRVKIVKTDALDRETEIVNTYGKSVYFIHDAQGNLSKTVDHYGNVISQGYDVRGRRTASIDPDLGSWTYTFNAFGEQVLEVDAKKQNTKSFYDKLGRLTERDEGDLISKFSFDTATHGIGKLAQASTPSYCQTPTYDALSRLWTTTTNIGGTSACSGGNDANFTTTTTYDDAGRIASLTYPTGVAIQYGYNSLDGHLEKIQNFTGGTAGKVYWQWQDTDAAGRIRAFAYANGVGTIRDYDAGMGWLNSINTGSGIVQSSAYFYDSVGSITQRSDRFDTPNMVEKTDHDLLGRLTSYALFDAAGQVEQPGTRINVSYDAIGDIKTKSDVGTYYYNPSGPGSVRPHAVGEIRGALNASYAYADANGSLTAGASRKWTYTSANLVASVGNASSCHRFLYQGERLRVQDLIYNVACSSADYVGPVERTVYLHPDAANGLQFEMDVKGGATTYRHFINAGSFVVGELTSTQMNVTPATPVAMNYFHYDHLGSIVAITNDAGNVVERRSFDPWGRPRQTTGAPGTGELPNGINEVTDRGFTLAEHLVNLGVIHMNGRVYDPTIGRFSSPDPSVAHADDLQSYNRFSYVENRPLISTDPTGFDDGSSCVWIVCYDANAKGGSGGGLSFSLGVSVSLSGAGSSSTGKLSNGYTDSASASPASSGSSISVTSTTPATAVTGPTAVGAPIEGVGIPMQSIEASFEKARNPAGISPRDAVFLSESALNRARHCADGSQCAQLSLMEIRQLMGAMRRAGTPSYNFEMVGLQAELGRLTVGFGDYNEAWEAFGVTGIAAAQAGGGGTMRRPRVPAGAGPRYRLNASPVLANDPYSPEAVEARSAQWNEHFNAPQQQAARLGYTRRIPAQKAPFDSHGQEVFTNGKKYISRDVDGHNATDAWKVFNSKGQRTGTWNNDLTVRIKD